MLQPFKMRLMPPPGKKLIRDWNGLRVRTRRVLRNGAAEMPIGSLATVETSGGTGLHLKFDKCHCCGAAVYMSRVPSSDVEVIDAVVKSTSPDGKEASMPMREATEFDFRMPEYRLAKPADYEVREDGKPVRKDRWEMGMRRVVSLAGIGAREEWEIDQVLDRLEARLNATRDSVIEECIAALREVDDGDAPEFSACIEKLQELST